MTVEFRTVDDDVLLGSKTIVAHVVDTPVIEFELSTSTNNGLPNLECGFHARW